MEGVASWEVRLVQHDMGEEHYSLVVHTPAPIPNSILKGMGLGLVAACCLKEVELGAKAQDVLEATMDHLADLVDSGLTEVVKQ